MLAVRAAETGARVASARRRVGQLRLPWIALFILSVLVVCAAFAPLLSPHDPTDIDARNGRLPPWTTSQFPLGTDVLGQDMLSRLIHGARTSVTVSLVALGLGAIVGTFLGVMSGYRGGWLDVAIMRIVDAFLGFPTILLALVIVVTLGRGLENIVIAVALTVWARFARMVRGEVLAVKGQDFVDLARVAGVNGRVIMWRHIFPNVVNTLMIVTGLLIGEVILLEASLSFLGLGLEPGTPSWGLMVAEGRHAIVDLWWLSLFPGLAITVVVMAFNFFADWLRDTLDPRLRRV